MNFFKELRSEFSNIFGSKPKVETPSQQGVAYKLLNDWNNYFCDPPKDIYLNPTVRTCIDTIAKNFSKVEMHHKRGSNIVKDSLEQILKRPNNLMSTYDFLYKVVSTLYMNGNAFIYIKTDNNGEIVGLYPITAISYELREVKDELYVKFQFAESTKTIAYRNLIHLRKYFFSNDILGSASDAALFNSLNILDATEQALENTVKNAAKIKGIITLNNIIRADDREKILDTFNERFVKQGIGILDQSAGFTPVNSSDSTVAEEKMKYMREAIYSYFSLNEDIISSKFTSATWNAFYESVLEPLAIQISEEFTDKIFTDNEKKRGHKISVTVNRLEYEDFDSKVNMSKNLLAAGILTINEVREIFGFESIPDGDERQISLNYVNSNDQTEYQLGIQKSKDIQSDTDTKEKIVEEKEITEKETK